MSSGYDFLATASEAAWGLREKRYLHSDDCPVYFPAIILDPSKQFDPFKATFKGQKKSLLGTGHRKGRPSSLLDGPQLSGTFLVYATNSYRIV